MSRAASSRVRRRSHSNGATARPTTRLERAARAGGYERVAGVDEVGRGCLFGPVVAAAVILDPTRPIRGLNDSKRLDPATRKTLDCRIRERALATSIAAIDSAQIDRVNIYQAARRAMRFAVLGLRPSADYLLIDAMKIDVEVPQQSVIRGDGVSRSIAAASIVAKVERDRWIELWDPVFPRYGLASNKGYATAHHLRALETYGPTPLHRHSFRPVALTARFPPSLAKETASEDLPLLANLPLGGSHKITG